MTCSQVANAIVSHLANGGVVLDTYGLCPSAKLKGITDASESGNLSRIQLTSYGTVSTTVGDDIDDFTLLDGVIRYQTKDDRYGANGIIQFLSPVSGALRPDPEPVADGPVPDARTVDHVLYALRQAQPWTANASIFEIENDAFLNVVDELRKVGVITQKQAAPFFAAAGRSASPPLSAATAPSNDLNP